MLLERGVLQTQAHEWGSTDDSACSLFSSRHAEHLLVLWAYHTNQVQTAALSGFQQQQKKATKIPPKSVAEENSGPLQPDTLLKIITPLQPGKADLHRLSFSGPWRKTQKTMNTKQFLHRFEAASSPVKLGSVLQ